jgi:hypothetical protein
MRLLDFLLFVCDMDTIAKGKPTYGMQCIEYATLLATVVSFNQSQ